MRKEDKETMKLARIIEEKFQKPIDVKAEIDKLRKEFQS